MLKSGTKDYTRTNLLISRYTALIFENITFKDGSYTSSDPVCRTIFQQVFMLVMRIGGVMKYRSSTEIIDSMLRSIRSGATKTHIMYRAYMSYSQLKEYLKLLEERQLIRIEPGSQLYMLTEKGLKFMNAYEKINELVPSVNESKGLFESRSNEIPVIEKEAFEY